MGTFKNLICTKTVYNYLDNGDIFTKISNKDLLFKKNDKKRKYRNTGKVALNNTKGTSIEERPKEIEKREEIGHWEIDLVIGQKGRKKAILTIVERKSRKLLCTFIKNKTQKEVIRAISRLARRVKGCFDQVFKTITSDNGVDFLDCSGIKKASRCVEVYYAHPYSSWERVSNENANRMLRRFIPKGTSSDKISEKKLKEYEDWINNYPSRILIFH
jgi:IS30 family transposase